MWHYVHVGFISLLTVFGIFSYSMLGNNLQNTDYLLFHLVQFYLGHVWCKSLCLCPGSL